MAKNALKKLLFLRKRELKNGGFHQKSTLPNSSTTSKNCLQKRGLSCESEGNRYFFASRGTKRLEETTARTFKTDCNVYVDQKRLSFKGF